MVSAQVLRKARADGVALVGFSIYNLEQGIGVVRAAEGLGLPVILQVGSNAFGYAGREPLVRLAQGLAEAARVPVGIHLDHSSSLAEIEACLELGYSSVMFDGSALPLAENIALTRQVVDLAHGAGAWVEAELVGIAGDEDESRHEVSAARLTDPHMAASFVEATDVDALAVAVGNVHGIPAASVDLDLELLGRLGQMVEIPLVLHGASGLPPDSVAQAIRLGVAKVNVNTELRRAVRSAIVGTAETLRRSDAIADWLGPICEAVELAAREKLVQFTAQTTEAGSR